MRVSRRNFLATTAAAGVLGVAPSLILPRSLAWSRADASTTLRIEKRVIDVLGKSADVFGIVQPDGTHGLYAEAGQHLRARLENRAGEETLIHWHGLTPPWRQDGVPKLSQPPLPPGATYDYDFELARAGTNWMHSHHGLQEQRLMAAPLIIRDPAESAVDAQEVVMIFHDFTFRDPDAILAGLKAGGNGVAQAAPSAAGHGSPAPSMPMGHGAMGHGQAVSPAVDAGATATWPASAVTTTLRRTTYARESAPDINPD